MAAFGVQFLTDLTLVVGAAAMATLLFYKLKQPVVLGYLLAGILIGPHTPGPVVGSLESVQALAELGVIFLMFSIGVEFRLSRLARAGVPAVGAALVQIVAVIALTLLLGRVFGWSATDALFLGAILAISSTVIAARAIVESGHQAERWAELALAVLIVEDVVAVAILAVLSASGQQAVGVLDVLGVLGRMATFALLVLVLGLLFLPRLVNHLARREANEVLVITLAGLALSTAFLALLLGFSPALGAFLAGAVVAEAAEVHHAEGRLFALRDLFSAVFFVSIGMLLDPRLLVQYWVPIAVLAVLLVVFRVALYSGPAMLFGARPRDAVRMSMAMSHIGEFSFVIAALGLALGVVSDFVLPVTIAVAALSAFWTPYMVRSSDRVFAALAARVPEALSASLAARRRQRLAARAVRREVLGPEGRRAAGRALINALAAGLLLSAVQGVSEAVEQEVTVRGLSDRTVALLPWLAGGLLALPFAINAARWASRLAGRLGAFGGALERPRPTRSRALGLLVVLAGAMGLFAVLVALAPFLPPLPVLLFGLAAFLGAAILLWGRMSRLHARVEAALADAFEGQPQGEDRLAVVDAILHEYRPGLEVERVRLRAGTLAVEGTLRDLALRARAGVMVVAVQRGERITVNPRADEELDPDDVLLLLGDPDQLARARAQLAAKAPPRGRGEEPRIAEVPVEPGAAVAGATLAETRLGERAGVTVLGVVRRGERLFNPPADARVEPGDVLLLMGTAEDLRRARALTRRGGGAA